MTKTMTRMIAAVAAMGLVATPIVAQANTRASDSAATYSTVNAAPGLGREAEGEGAVAGPIVWIVGLLGFTAAGFAAAIAAGEFTEADGECISPGAC
jgi:hypothetical protein